MNIESAQTLEPTPNVPGRKRFLIRAVLASATMGLLGSVVVATGSTSAAAVTTPRAIAVTATVTHEASTAETIRSTVTPAPTVAMSLARAAGSWVWYGYRLTWSETNQIANLSLWSAFWGVRGSNLIPYSQAIMGVYAVNWVLTARNARSMGRCLAISYAGVGLIVGC